MHVLRTSRCLSSLVLAWFVLFVGVSLASPLLKQGTLEMVCSVSGGMKLVASSDTGDLDPSVPTGMDCPLCLTVAPPPVPVVRTFDPPSPLAHAVQTIRSALLVTLTAPPLPSRGPPHPLLSLPLFA